MSEDTICRDCEREAYCEQPCSEYDNHCPDCGAKLIHESGCVTCPNCGWGKCG